MEIAELYPEDLRLGAEYSQPIEPTDLSGKTLIQREFSSVSLTDGSNLRLVDFGIVDYRIH